LLLAALLWSQYQTVPGHPGLLLTERSFLNPSFCCILLEKKLEQDILNSIVLLKKKKELLLLITITILTSHLFPVKERQPL
jgi:hypothetical protein